MSRTPAAFLAVPDDILSDICALLPPQDLANLRLTCRYMNSLASALVFKEVRVNVQSDQPNFRMDFVNIAQDDSLRKLVRKLRWTSEPSLGVELPDITPWQYVSQNIERFSNLRSLVVGQRSAFLDARDHKMSIAAFSQALCSLFQSLAQSLHPRGPVRIEELHVNNQSLFMSQTALNDFSFRRILESKDLTILKIDFWREAYTRHRKFVQVHDIAHTQSYVPTLLAPAVVSKLTDLTIMVGHDDHYWGASERIDIVAIGDKQSLPNLRRFALKNYVFTRQVEIDWIASLPIAELYLNNCALLQVCFHLVPRVNFEDDDIEEDSPVKEDEYLCVHCALDWRFDARQITRWQPLTWSRVLEQWNEAMENLLVFRLGRRKKGISDSRNQSHYPRAKSPFVMSSGDDEDFQYASFGFNRRSWKILYPKDPDPESEGMQRDKGAHDAFQAELIKRCSLRVAKI